MKATLGVRGCSFDGCSAEHDQPLGFGSGTTRGIREGEGGMSLTAILMSVSLFGCVGPCTLLSCGPCVVPCECPTATEYSVGKVRYFNGEILMTVEDLSPGGCTITRGACVVPGGFGLPWGHTRSYSNQLTQPCDRGMGPNWLVRQ